MKWATVGGLDMRVKHLFTAKSRFGGQVVAYDSVCGRWGLSATSLWEMRGTDMDEIKPVRGVHCMACARKAGLAA